MYKLTIKNSFSAYHSLVIKGQTEESHIHNWEVSVSVSGDKLDNDGLLCDFHDLEQGLNNVIAPFRLSNLNEVPPFTQMNPSAERVAEYIATEMAGLTGFGITQIAVTVMEAPDCTATYTMATG